MFFVVCTKEKFLCFFFFPPFIRWRASERPPFFRFSTAETLFVSAVAMQMNRGRGGSPVSAPQLWSRQEKIKQLMISVSLFFSGSSQNRCSRLNSASFFLGVAVWDPHFLSGNGKMFLEPLSLIILCVRCKLLFKVFFSVRIRCLG